MRAQAQLLFKASFKLITFISENDGSEEDLEITFSLTFEEVPGKRKGSVLYQTCDDHLWRSNKKLSDTKRYLYSYHFIPTVDSRVTTKCHATAILDLDARRNCQDCSHEMITVRF